MKSCRNSDRVLRSYRKRKILAKSHERRKVVIHVSFELQVKINFKLKNYPEAMNKYSELLTYIESSVTKNRAEKSINAMLDFASTTSGDIVVLQNVYETTLGALRHANNNRLWFKTNTKLGKVYLDRGEFGKLATIIRQLYQCCQTEDVPDDDLHRGTQLLEIYALEIQMCTVQKNYKQLKASYQLFEQTDK